MSRYLIIIEETATGYSAYSPDLPGCIAAGKARDSVEREMHDAIEFHLDGLWLPCRAVVARRRMSAACTPFWHLVIACHANSPAVP